MRQPIRTLVKPRLGIYKTVSLQQSVNMSRLWDVNVRAKHATTMIILLAIRFTEVPGDIVYKNVAMRNIGRHRLSNSPLHSFRQFHVIK